MKHTIFEILSVLVEMEESEELNDYTRKILTKFLPIKSDIRYGAVEFLHKSSKNKLIFEVTREEAIYSVVVTPGFVNHEIKVKAPPFTKLFINNKEAIKARFNEIGNSEIDVGWWENGNVKTKLMEIPEVVKFNSKIKEKWKNITLNFLKENGLGNSTRGFAPIEIRKAIGELSEKQIRIICYELEKEGKIVSTGKTKAKRWVIKELENEALKMFEKHQKDREERFKNKMNRILEKNS